MLNAVATTPTAALALAGTQVPDQFPLPACEREMVRLSLLRRTNTPPLTSGVPQSSTTSTRRLTGLVPVTVKPGASERKAGTSALGVQLPAARGRFLPVTVAAGRGQHRGHAHRAHAAVRKRQPQRSATHAGRQSREVGLHADRSRARRQRAGGRREVHPVAPVLGAAGGHVGQRLAAQVRDRDLARPRDSARRYRRRSARPHRRARGREPGRDRPR